MSWNKMCHAKREGGMGFRDPEAFNQALLAKQAWRILQTPSSLCAQVIKARYFPEGSIMSATCPSGGSFTFRSILYGRDLLREGLVWRIGDGTAINVHHDNWIPRQGSLSRWDRSTFRTSQRWPICLLQKEIDGTNKRYKRCLHLMTHVI